MNSAKWVKRHSLCVISPWSDYRIGRALDAPTASINFPLRGELWCMEFFEQMTKLLPKAFLDVKFKLRIMFWFFNPNFWHSYKNFLRPQSFSRDIFWAEKCIEDKLGGSSNSSDLVKTGLGLKTFYVLSIKVLL